MEQKPAVHWPTPLSRRWDISLNTLWRWRREGLIPEPDVHIAGRHGWSASVVEKIERSDVAKAAA